VSELTIVKQLHQPVHVKTFMNELNDLVNAGRQLDAFNLAFERGDTSSATPSTPSMAAASTSAPASATATCPAPT
jgi:hypothetical protein